VGISRGRLSQIVNNTNFGEISTLLSRGRDMDYIASHYHMDLALALQKNGGQARALGLEGKTDQKKIWC